MHLVRKLQGQQLSQERPRGKEGLLGFGGDFCLIEFSKNEEERFCVSSHKFV